MTSRYCVFFLSIFSCAGAIAASSDQNVMQTVFVYRPSSISSWGRTNVVSVNGIASTELTNCTFSKLKLPVGIHRIDMALKPWPLDRVTTAPSLTVYVSPYGPAYIGYYPYELSPSEVSATFVFYSQIKGHAPAFIGLARPEVASKEMVSCSAVKSLNE